LRRVFGHETRGVTGKWRKTQNEELHNLLSDQRRRDREDM
jgi:hypothetical protein